MLGFGGAMAVLLALFFIGILSLSRLQDSYEKISHTYEVISQIHLINSDLHESQASVRGYMLSPQPVFLAMAESRVSHVMEDAWAVEQLTVDNPRQGENFKKLLPLLHLILGRIERNIHLCSMGRRDEAVKLFRSGNTSLDNQRLQSALDQMTAEEQTLLQARRNSWRNAAASRGSCSSPAAPFSWLFSRPPCG